MHAEHGVAGEAFQQLVVEHGQGAADALLAGLEDQVHGAVEILRLRQIAGGAQQHGGVAVMAAGMHPPGRLAFIGEVVGLRHGQRVHIRAQADPARPVAGAQHADHAGLADAAMHLDPPFLQLRRDDGGGAVLLQPQFRMSVQIVADGGQCIVVATDVIEGGHGDSFV